MCRFDQVNVLGLQDNFKLFDLVLQVSPRPDNTDAVPAIWSYLCFADPSSLRMFWECNSSGLVSSRLIHSLVSLRKQDSHLMTARKKKIDF